MALSFLAAWTYAAAMTPDIIARCTPDENKGSTKQAASPTSTQPSPAIFRDVYDQSLTTSGPETTSAAESMSLVWRVESNCSR